MIPTFHGEKETTGFAKSIPKENRTPPLKLMIKPADLLKYRIKNVNFTPAKFNIGDGIVEVASCVL